MQGLQRLSHVGVTAPPRPDDVEGTSVEAVLNQSFLVDAEEEPDQHRDHLHRIGRVDHAGQHRLQPT